MSTIFFLFYLLSFVQCSSKEFLCQNEGNCIDFDAHEWMTSSKSTLPPSIVTIQPFGRLGNHLISFGVIQGLQKIFDAYIMRETFNYISETFEVNEKVSSIPILEDTFCDPWKMNFVPFEGSIDDLVNNQELHRGKILNLWPDGYKNKDNICCPTTELMKYMLDRDDPAILSTLNCKEDFRDHAESTLKHISENRITSSSTKPPLFIGVHDRRTDYTSYVQEKFGLKELKKSYFSSGMEYFEEEFGDDFDVIFIWVSDNLSWGKQKFKKKKNVYFAGDADESLPSKDFCILSSCNHTIMTRGSFSTFASVLAKGEVYTEYGAIVPAYLQNKKKKRKPHQIY